MLNKSLFKKAAPVRPETFAIQVQGYDVKSPIHTVSGVRLDTGDPVKVSLAKIDNPGTGKKKRTEIAQFAAPRKKDQDASTEVGGILMVEQALRQGDGTYSARWLTSLSHHPQEAEVFMATVHMTPVKTGPKGKPYSLLTLIHTGDFSHLSDDMKDALRIVDPQPVSNVEELEQTLKDFLDNNIGAGVRLKAGDEFDGVTVSPRKDSTSEQVVADFMKTRLDDDIKAMLDAGQIQCEIIPYTNVWGGKDTVASLLESQEKYEQSGNHNGVSQRIARFNESMIGNNGQPRNVDVFRPAIVAVRFTKEDEQGNRSAYFTRVEPLFTAPPLKGRAAAIKYAQTEFFKPDLPSITRPAADVPAASPQETTESFSGDMDVADDDLVGAAADEPVEAPAPAPAPTPAVRTVPNRQAGANSAARRFAPR